MPTPVSVRGGFQKGPMGVTTVAYPKTNRGLQGIRRITVVQTPRLHHRLLL
jgi:hypothetical protein